MNDQRIRLHCAEALKTFMQQCSSNGSIWQPQNLQLSWVGSEQLHAECYTGSVPIDCDVHACRGHKSAGSKPTTGACSKDRIALQNPCGRANCPSYGLLSRHGHMKSYAKDEREHSTTVKTWEHMRSSCESNILVWIQILGRKRDVQNVCKRMSAQITHKYRAPYRHRARK